MPIKFTNTATHSIYKATIENSMMLSIVLSAKDADQVKSLTYGLLDATGFSADKKVLILCILEKVNWKELFDALNEYHKANVKEN